MKKILVIFIALFFVQNLVAQDFSNKGKDFWFAYPAHNAGTTSRLAIYITSDQTTTGTVQYNGNTIAFSVVANQTTIVRIGNATTPSNATCYIGSNNVVEVNKGIHISALKPVAAYAHILNSAVSGSTLLLPTNVLGKDYVVSTYVPQGNTAGVEKCQFVIVGVENNTTVEITPINADISNSHPANVPFQITLNKGDVYQYQSFTELAGTKVLSIANGISDCKPIVVIGSTTRSAIGCATAASGDNLFQQLTPKSSWGKNYITVPFILKNRDIIRIYVSNPTAPVTVNGTVLAFATLINNSYYELNASTTQQISSSEGIAVYQYIITQNCDNVSSDPEMVLINSIEQTLNDISFVSAHQALTPPNTNITSHYLNVIIKDQGTALSSLLLDGAIVPAASFTPVGATNYKFARINLTSTTTAANPTHRILSDSGFIAIAYGYGNVESYGYNAGTNIKDLNKKLEFENQLSIINANSVCLNSPVQFKVFLPDSSTNLITGITSAIRYDSMKWNISSPTSFSPNNFPRVFYGNTTFAAPNNIGLKVAPDSLRIRNGKSVAWYSIQPPTSYTISTPNTYTLTLTCYRTSVNEGCASGNDIDFEFEFIVPPISVPDFSKSSPGCAADTVQFMETTPQLPYPTYHFWWDFGDGTPVVTGNTTSNLTPSFRNPRHKYTNPGTYTVRFSNITTPGCVSDTISRQIIIPDTVNASIAGTSTVCQSTVAGSTLPITFTGVAGVMPYTFTYIITTNGVPGLPQTIQSITSPSNLPTAVINVPVTTAGVYKYSLVKVENANPAFCFTNVTNQEATITVNPIPTASISGTTNVCKNSAPAPVVTFTGTGGVSATSIYEFTYIPSVNGVPGAAQTINSNIAGVATITVPTTTIGTFKYDIISVKDVGTTCSQVLTAGATTTATVFVQDNPTATIATNDVVECVNGTQPIITFTGNSGNGQPLTYTFNYTITTNGIPGIPQNITTTTASNTATLSVPVTTAATYIYTLNSVTTNSTAATSCVTTITNASVAVTINPIPSATISGTTTVCQVAGAQTITLTGAGGTRPYTFTYTINGVAQPTVVSDPGLDTKVLTVSTAIGNYVYKITQVQDASSSTCIKNYAAPTEPTATVIMQATSTATISPVTTTVCQDVATAPVVTFIAANGTAPFKFIYTVTTNGITGANQTATALTGTSAPITVPLTTVGTLVYTLLSVENTGPTTCVTNITGQTATVIINPIPTATIGTTTTVCQNSPQVPVTFIGAGGTGGAGATYVFNYTLSINGGAAVAQTPTAAGNNIIVNQATATPGTYTYVITSVKDNLTGCTKTYTTGAPTTTITVKQLATATVTTSVPTVCQNSTTLPVITFTATGGVAPYTFTYKLNGGANQTLTTLVGNSRTINAPTITAGTFVYTLVSVEESANSCVNAQTGSTQVIVHPQPTASFTTTAPYCAFKKVTFTPIFGITPTGSVTSWIWNYGDGTGQQIRTDGLPFDVTYLTAGVKPVTFKTVSDKGCESVLYTQNVIINSKPKAGFKSPEACLADSYADFADTSSVAGLGASIVNWSWDFGDGTPIYSGGTTGPQSHQNPRHPYLVVGQKTVTLIVTSNSGCKDTIVQSFFINGEVTKANFIRLSNNYCSNRPVQIKDASVVNVGGLIRVEIYWDYLNAPTVLQTDNTPTPGETYTHSYPNLQTDVTYKVRYFAYSGFNGVCQKDTIIDLVVHASPVAVFTTPLDVCLNGGPVVLNTGTASGGVGVYTALAGVTFSGGVYTFNPLAAGVVIGNNNITYTVTSPFNCDSAKVQPIKVLAPPVVNTFTTIGNKCHNNAVTFHNTYTNGDGMVVKWIYNWGDGTANTITTTSADVTHVYTTVNTFTATLTLETGYGCKNVPFPLTVVVNPLPVTLYSFTNSVCLPNAVITFTNTTASIGSNTYQWSFEYPSTNAADISTQANLPTHQYMSQGPFNTHLVATNIVTGCKDSSTIGVINGSTIHLQPVLTFSPIPNVCLNGGTVNITQAGETSGMLGGPGIYTCVDVPAAITTLGIFNPLTAGVGFHTIKYSWTSSFNCTTTITQTVKVLAPPIVNTFITTGNACERNKINFHNTISQGDGNVVQWVYVWGDGSTNTLSNGNDTTHIYATAQTYTATLQLITDYGCKSAPPKPITLVVNPLPKPNFIFSDTVCLPAGLVKFKNTTPNINDNMYKWYSDDLPPIIKLGIDNDYTYINIGPHDVKLIATNSVTFCADSIIKSVNTIHPAPLAAFDFNQPSVCIGADVTVIDRSTFADGTGNKWNWKWGDNAIAQGQTPAAHTYADANTYKVYLKIINNYGCFDDTTRPFTVYPYPVVDAGRDSAILEGGQILLTPTVTGNDLRYKWTSRPLPVYLNNDSILNPIATPAVDITYKLTVRARGGCAASDTVFIKVLKYPIIPNTFSPNRADTKHTFWEIQYLSSYPDNRVQIFTRTGQLVFESRGYKTPWNGTNLNGNFLPFDTYYYIVEPGSGRKPLTGYVTIVK